jgi:hypothetical protein
MFGRRSLLGPLQQFGALRSTLGAAEGRLKDRDFLLRARPMLGTMPRQKQRPPNPNGPDPQDAQTKWLLFMIAILFGLLVSQLAKRLM